VQQIQAGPHADDQDAIGRLNRGELEHSSTRALEETVASSPVVDRGQPTVLGGVVLVLAGRDHSLRGRGVRSHVDPPPTTHRVKSREVV
jgi:hypothetical protein